MKNIILLLTTFVVTSFSPSTQSLLKKENNVPPTFSAKGLHNEKLLTDIFKGEFINIPFDREKNTFALILNEYIDAYAVHCKNSLPANKVELMRPECVTERVTKDAYGWEISRTCVEWVYVGRGLYAAPKMRDAQKVIEKLQTTDALRNMYKMMQQDNPIGEAYKIVNTANAIKEDMVKLLSMNGCKSAGLMRFQENLRLFAHNKQPIKLDGSSAPNMVVTTNNQNFSKLAEDLVFEHSKTWAMNRYQRGSISNATITQKDSKDQPKEMKASYIYTGWTGRSTGSVRITFTDGVPECLYFHDFPTTCRSANRRIVSQFTSGIYKK